MQQACVDIAVITDPGPDPDDIKAILVAAVLHREGTVRLRCVIANGGGEQEVLKRATLARVFLDHLHARDIPVGIGTVGKDYAPHPHEYEIVGFDVAAARPFLQDGAQLLMRTLHASAPGTLAIVCISSLRDLADAIAADPELVVSRVKLVAIQGGLEREAGSERWRADASVNNGFDMDAAQRVYDFCFARRVPMTVTSRHAVPVLPMQLAKSFATRTKCPVMSYLADAQFKGLEGLWSKLCEGKLPERCSKQWYFETFCGVGKAQFEANGCDSFDASIDIVSHLNGFVKPYDVVALMTALPITRPLFSKEAEHDVNGMRHLLLLEPSQCISQAHVIKLLRNTYHDVVLLTARKARYSEFPSSPGAEMGEGTSADWGTWNGGAHSKRERHTMNGRASRASDVRSGSIKGKQLLRSRVTTAWHEPERNSGDGNSRGRGDYGSRGRTTRTTTSSESLGSAKGALFGSPALRRLLSQQTKHSPDAAPKAPAPVAPESAARALPADAPATPIAKARRSVAMPMDLDELEALLERALVDVRRRQTRIALPTTLASLAVLIVLLALRARWVAGEDARAQGEAAASVGVASGALVVSALISLSLLLLGLTLQPVSSFRRVFALTYAMLGAHGLTSCVLRALWLERRLTAAGVLLGSGARDPAAAESSGAVGFFGEREKLLLTVLLAVVDALLGMGSAALCASAARRTGASSRSLLESFCRLVGGWLGICGAVHLAEASFGARAAAVDAMHGLASALELLCALALVLRRVRGSFRGAIARLTRDKGRSAAIAPLLGFGSRHESSPAEVIAAASRAFRPVALTSSRLADLRFCAEESGARLSRTWNLPPELSRCSTNGTAASSARTSRRKIFDAAEPSGHHVLAQHDVADYLIVHAGKDDCKLRERALARWAERRARRSESVPIVWCRELSAEGELSAVGRLEHSVVHLARAKKLLLLWGPSFVDDLHALMHIWVWRLLKGSMANVEVVPVIANADESEALVASIDAFAVVHAAEHLVATEDGRRIALALESDSISRFNELVRGYLPLVTAAIAQYKAADEPTSTQGASERKAAFETVRVGVTRDSVMSIDDEERPE